MTTHEAYFILNLLPDIGPLRVNQLLRQFENPVEILQSRSHTLTQVAGISSRLADVITGWRDYCDPEAEKDFARKAGVKVICREDPDYPEMLREIADPPLVLYLCGECEVLGCLSQALAMVGTRGPSNYGVKMAHHLATAAVYSGWTVVSGLARGIDAAAHRAVIEAEGCTLAVLGGGLAQVYPPENRELARDICRSGLLISELPMKMKPTRLTFPMRNRLIAGLTLGTVVVEAGTRSGALITAAQALEQNRRVFAVPGRVDSPQARGCHSLLKDGATLVERFEDIDGEFDFGLPFPGELKSSRVAEEEAATTESRPAKKEEDGALRTLTVNLTDLEKRLLELIGGEEMHIDELISKSGEPAHLVLATLSGLEMRHLIDQMPGKRVSIN